MPRLCLCGPGQELAVGADRRGAGWSTTVPRVPRGLETVRSELGVPECMCSCGCRCVWLWWWWPVCPLSAFAWAFSSTVAAYRGKKRERDSYYFSLYWSQYKNMLIRVVRLNHTVIVPWNSLSKETKTLCRAAQLDGISLCIHHYKRPFSLYTNFEEILCKSLHKSKFEIK